MIFYESQILKLNYYVQQVTRIRGTRNVVVKLLLEVDHLGDLNVDGKINIEITVEEIGCEEVFAGTCLRTW